MRLFASSSVKGRRRVPNPAESTTAVVTELGVAPAPIGVLALQLFGPVRACVVPSGMAAVRRLLAPVLCLGALSFTGCGTDAMATDACRKIEQARCRRAAACPAINLQGSVGVEECVQFARDRCLHGLPVADPGPAAVDQCVAAIGQMATCDAVVSPEPP